MGVGFRVVLVCLVFWLYVGWFVGGWSPGGVVEVVFLVGLKDICCSLQEEMDHKALNLFALWLCLCCCSKTLDTT